MGNLAHSYWQQTGRPVKASCDRGARDCDVACRGWRSGEKGGSVLIEPFQGGCNIVTRLSDNMRGALLMMLTMAAYTFNDACIKSVANDLPLFQAVFLRGVMTSAMLAGFALWRGELRLYIPRGDRLTLFLRLAGEVGATIFFLQALFNMPIANVTAVMQSLPLAITLAGAVFLGERVGWRRYGAIAIGFAGVMLIVRPGADGFDVYSLSALVAVGFVVLRDLTTRRLSGHMPSMTVALMTALSITALGAVGSLYGGWQPVSGRSIGLLALAAVFIFAGYLFSVMVMRVGEISFTAPFRYTGLVWAILLGIVVFGEIPDTLMLVGSFVVVGMGIYTFYRERRLSRATGG